MRNKIVMTDQQFEWNRIYEIDAEHYSGQLERNREYYRQIDDPEFTTIYDCVNHAIREGNHAAFAHFFLKEERSQSAAFGKVLSQLLEERKKVNGYCESVCWVQAPIIQQNYWRALDFQYTWKNIQRTISSKKNKTIAYKIDLEKGKESLQRANWRKGKAIPTRDVIVQIAICLGISLEDTNRLLRAACMPALYVLDVVDVCSMFMIREYENNYSISPFEKLAMTKEQINKALRECLNNKLDTVSIMDVHLLGSQKPLGMEIDKEISEIKKVIEGTTQYRDPNTSITMYLTRLFEDRFNSSKDVDAFFGTNQTIPGHSRSTYRAFLQKYYGFLHRTKMFIENTQSYEKNLRYSGWKLTADGKDIIASFQRAVGNQGNPYRVTTKKGIQLVDRIWHIADLVGENGKEFTNGDDWIAIKPFPGALTIPRQMIEGRRINSNDTGKKNKSFVYEMNYGNKVHLMKFAIATGNEDQAGKYLQLSGVWECDWYEFIKNEKEIPIQLDRSDYLLLYALLFRDKLIERWNDSDDPVNASAIRDAFPMIKLLLTISRDITLASMKLYDESGKMRDYDNYSFPGLYEEKLVKLQGEMIYPIAWYFIQQNVRNKSLNLNLDEHDRDEDTIGLWRLKVSGRNKQEK